MESIELVEECAGSGRQECLGEIALGINRQELVAAIAGEADIDALLAELLEQ